MRYLILAILDFGNTHKENLRKEYMLEAYRVWTLALTHFSFLLVQKDLIRFQSTLLEYPHKTSSISLAQKKKKEKKKKEKENEDIFPLPNSNLWKNTIVLLTLYFLLSFSIVTLSSSTNY